MSKSTVLIPSKVTGWNLEAWQYLPASKGKQKPPVVIMAHGFSGTKKMGLEPFAQEFVKLGYGALLFDYRAFGGSDGTPRYYISTRWQREDYQSVISFAQRASSPFDPTRVILFGSSFSGGTVSWIASHDHSIAAVMGQCPYTHPIVSTTKLSVVSMAKLLPYSLYDVARQVIGLEPYYVPAVCEPGEFGALSVKGALAQMSTLCSSSSDHVNTVQASVIFEVLKNWPVWNAKDIECPYLLVLPEEDEMCPAWVGKRAVEQAKQGEMVWAKLGHFDVYPGHKSYETSLNAMKTFLQKHVPV